PQNIFNPNKIVDTPSMNTMLRYTPGQQTPAFKTVFRFYNQDILQHAEQCNGSGDCRKTHLSGGTMCPSYMATRNEQDTTRARANILREFLTNSDKVNRFDHKEIYEVMDLCLSCKACKTECPSNVDMAKLKAEVRRQTSDVRHRVYLFCDEFTNYNDTEIGIKAILLLEKLGYEVTIPQHEESGRANLSKGLIREGKKIANKNIELLKNIVT